MSMSHCCLFRVRFITFHKFIGKTLASSSKYRYTITNIYNLSSRVANSNHGHLQDSVHPLFGKRPANTSASVDLFHFCASTMTGIKATTGTTLRVMIDRWPLPVDR